MVLGWPRQAPGSRYPLASERPVRDSVRLRTATPSARLKNKLEKERSSSFFDNGSGRDTDLLELRFVRDNVNAELGDGKQRFGVLEIGDGFAKRHEIGLRQFDQPVVFTPTGQFGLFEIGIALEAGDSFVDLLIRKKRFHARREPCDRSAVRG